MSRLAFVVSLLITLSPGAALACRQPEDAARVLQATLAAINAERSQRGMAALVPDPRLQQAAQTHACDSATRNRMGHHGSDDSTLATRVQRQGYRFRSIAENVAAGHPTPAAVVRGWMGSAGHRRNILARDARDAGIGLAIARDGTLHWVLNLGRKG